MLPRRLSPVVAVLLLGAVAADAKRDSLTAAVREWIQGPVRYIALPEEIDLFKSLPDDTARAAFIEYFWRRRDPRPETLTNEYRELFWRRVNEANERFADSAKPGWKTDRGKVHVLYGAPSRIEDDPYFDPRLGGSSGRGVIRWIYEGREMVRSDAGIVTVVPFVRDVSGEYRLSQDPRLASEFYDLDSIRDRMFYERFLDVDLIAPASSPLTVMLDLGRMQELPSREALYLERIDTYETFLTASLDVSTQVYRGGSGTESVVSIAAAAPDDAEAPFKPALIARLKPAGGIDGPRVVLGEGSFQWHGEGARRQAQARAQVPPGRYDLTVLFFHPAGGGSKLHRSTLEVGRSEDEVLRLSDVALVEELDPLPFATLASYSEPYVVGGFNVVPRTAPRVPRGEPVGVFFEIYGGTPPYDVRYQLVGREADGSWRELGPPQTAPGGEASQGFSLPTGERWPLGRYRLDIVVADAAGAARERSVDFELVEP